ncbi:hypothetical protein [Oceanobacillus sp. FSL K6-0251]|uniref:hypothetical protein n=1 Tax=Oceanobacillus sp. FSL K6-0251 TaxID=2921602 RepID=UPI0030F96760
MSKYFIQTRTIWQREGGNLIEPEWATGDEFDNFTKAETRCREIIENTNIKANDIRICKVVGEFESTVSVKTKEQG